MATVLEAWRAWEETGEITDPVQLADTLVRAHQKLATRLADLRRAAERELSRLDEVWRPMSILLFTWHGQAQRVAQEAGLFQPFAEATQKIWDQLRQQSNVELGAVRLTGTRSASKVVLDVAIDGTPSAALSVMSQGELHALALSLFLPRATVEESPFRFLVIDDPVQAMDPAKVKGLARVLAEVARTRQVIVFTHDDRVTRYLDDARAIAKTPEMPDDLKRELVATYCRGTPDEAGPDPRDLR